MIMGLGLYMPQFRGPAIVTKVMTPTTFQIEHKGRTYKRCLTELRPYRARNDPTLDTGVAPDSATSFEIGAFIAYRDTDDDNDPDSKRFHLGKVTNVADGEAHVHCYATSGKALSHASWKPLKQNAKGKYHCGNVAPGESVIDRIPVNEDEWVVHYNVQLAPNGRIDKRTRRQLQASKVTHHRIGHTF